MDRIDPVAGIICAIILWIIWGVIRYREERARISVIQKRILRGQPFDEETK